MDNEISRCGRVECLRWGGSVVLWTLSAQGLMTGARISELLNSHWNDDLMIVPFQGD
jgi:hypothetical protein